MKGFNILLFDQRGRGESEGKGLLLVNASQDIGGAVDYIKNRNSGDIIIMGLSLGAALSLTCQEDVTAIISDTSFTNVKDMFIKQTTVETNLPEPLIRFLAPGIFFMGKVIYGYDAVNPIDKVADIGCPILFINGAADDHILPEDAVELFEASDNPSDELWIVPSAGHCQGYRSNPPGYIDKITGFLTRK
ncbi:MAG: alpha/beta hydrolase, partial [Dehalococcoidales bacterium]